MGEATARAPIDRRKDQIRTLQMVGSKACTLVMTTAAVAPEADHMSVAKAFPKHTGVIMQADGCAAAGAELPATASCFSSYAQCHAEWQSSPALAKVPGQPRSQARKQV